MKENRMNICKYGTEQLGIDNVGNDAIEPPLKRGGLLTRLKGETD